MGTQESAKAPAEYYADGGIKSDERRRKYGEVFTPEWLVQDMLNMMEKENEDFFKDPFKVLTANYLDPAVGTGNFPAEILRRKLDICETVLDGVIAIGTIYGIDIQQDNVEETRQRLKDMLVERFKPTDAVLTLVNTLLEHNIICGNFLTGLNADGSKIWFLEDCKEYWEEIERRQREEEKKARRKSVRKGAKSS